MGVTNAAISFGVLNALYYGFGQGKITASIIATGLALLFSFAMNRVFVFADTSRSAHVQFIPFALVTISGSFIVLNAVYIISLQLLQGNEQPIINALQSVTGLTASASFVDINLSTVFGAIAAMFWNYNGYRLFVFKSSSGQHGQKGFDEAQQAQEV